MFILLNIESRHKPQDFKILLKLTKLFYFFLEGANEEN